MNRCIKSAKNVDSGLFTVCVLSTSSYPLDPRFNLRSDLGKDVWFTVETVHSNNSVPSLSISPPPVVVNNKGVKFVKNNGKEMIENSFNVKKEINGNIELKLFRTEFPCQS